MSGIVLGLIFVGVFGAGVLVGGTFGYLHRKEVTQFVNHMEDKYNDQLMQFAKEVESWKTK